MFEEVQTALSVAEPGLPTERKGQLTILNGARAGTVVEVSKEHVRAGKGEDNDVVLPDATVSRDHFELIQQGDAYLIRDLNSTNGLWLDQHRIREAFLRPGSVIKAGDIQLRFEPLFKPMAVSAWPEQKFGALVARSQRMRELFSMLNRLSATDATVLILGETGSGKGAVSRAIHDASPRKAKPFVVLDCGAIADNLIESEIFGHERGAFTGATATRKGALELAAGGTLFIDELLELRLDLQPKLLRALEEREFRRVGSSQTIKLEARVIAASQRDLWQQVQLGKFREDLYFRIAVFTLPIPPLRDRPEDIPLLAENFVKQIPGAELAKLTPQIMWRLQQHNWPGNVRELRNVVERALYLADGDDPQSLFTGVTAFPSSRPNNSILPAAGAAVPAPVPVAAARPHRSTPSNPLPVQQPAPAASSPALPTFHISVGAPSSGMPPSVVPSGGFPQPVLSEGGTTLVLSAELDIPFKEAKEKLLEAFEPVYIKRLMERTHGQVSAAAREAGIDRKHLYTLLKKYGLMAVDEP
jgi:DNA-binding NtrC family response regulator